jgi:sugar/nucleoside kinase (ribokinase family)
MSHATHDVICVGILVADVFAPPLARLPRAGELLAVDDLLLQTGGCAANTGADLAKLGVRVAVVGKVGNDVFADFIRTELTEKGVDASAIRVSGTAPTSRTVILPVIGEDRRYIHAVGANADLSIDDISLNMVAQARVLYVGGYRLFPGFDDAALARLFAFARQHQVKTVLDVAGVRAEEGLTPFRRVLPLTDVFLPNDDEARLITGMDDPQRQARCFVEAGAAAAVVTLGARGSVAVTRDLTLKAGTFPVRVLDPSGGGDAFDAGFIVGLLEGWDIRQTLTFASAIGASACTALGCTAGVFTRAEAASFLNSNHLAVSTETTPAV